MAYATLAGLREVTHFSTAEISDTDVNALIADADKSLLRLATIEVYKGKLNGSIDGVNVLFTTKNKPIADTDFDCDVDGDDVTAYLVAYDSEQNEQSSATAVTSVNARDGIITLTTAPTTANAEVGVYIDYRYYNYPVDYDLLKLAANYFLAHKCEMKIRTERMEHYPISNEPGISSKQSQWLSLAQATLTFSKPGLKVI